MATKKPPTKQSKALLNGGLFQSNPLLANAALVFALVFAGFGGYIIHGTSSASSPEIRSNLAGGKFCIDDWNGTLGTTKPGGAADVFLYNCVGDANQRFARYGNQIRLGGMAQCLDVKGQSTANGARVDLYPCINNQKNQQWTFSGGQIIGVGSGKCLDVPGGSASNQQYLEIWACNGGTNQKWTLDNYGEASTAGLNCKGTSGWNNYGSAPTSYCAYAVKWVGYYGWPSNQSEVTCASSVFNYESGWRTTATNPKSGAYGIPQAYPGSKMASMGSDWQTNADTQIHWGISYMKSTYKSPCGAWSFEKANGWY